MNSSFPSLKLGSLATLFALLLVVVSTGCGSLMQRTASLEDDELYLDRGEEFITDAEYLAYAYEQAGYDAAAGEYKRMDSRSGDAFQSSFGYVPQSLRGRSMLRGYMTPYGAAGFGPNPYDPWGSSFYGGYSAYNPGFYDPYNPYGSPMGNFGWGSSSWGINPYVGSFGYNPYAYSPYGYGYTGYNPYGYGVGGFGGVGGNGGVYGGYGNGWGWGSDVFTVSNVVVAPRTPIWSSTSVNSNASGGRLLTNKDEEIQATGEPAAPMTIWRGVDAVGTGASRPAATSTRPTSTQSSSTKPEYISPARSKTTRSSRSNSSWGSSSGSNSGSSTRSSSSRSTTTRSSSSSRNSSWSGSSSGSSRSSGSSTRSSSSSGSSRGSSGSSTGRSGGSSRNSGRGGGQPLR